MAVKEPHRAEVQVQVAGALAMVAGKNPQSARVIRHRLVEAELRREIRDEIIPLAPRRTVRAGLLPPVGVLPSHVRLELHLDAFQLAQESLIPGNLLQPGLPGKLQDAQGVVVGGGPQGGVELAEQAPGGRFPGPPQVIDDLAQRFEGGRELGNDVERLDRSLHNGMVREGWTLAGGNGLTSPERVPPGGQSTGRRRGTAAAELALCQRICYNQL